MGKEKCIEVLISKLQFDFGSQAFDIVDHWEADACAIGIAIPSDHAQLVYISTDDEEKFYFELESKPSSPGKVYDSIAQGEGVSYKELIEAISKHLQIEVISEIERCINFYEWFVDSLRDGYKLCINEYTNDLSCRDVLHRERESEEARAIALRVEAADKLLKQILIPTETPITRSEPREKFWQWGYPPNSPELERGLKSMGIL